MSTIFYGHRDVLRNVRLAAFILQPRYSKGGQAFRVPARPLRPNILRSDTDVVDDVGNTGGRPRGTLCFFLLSPGPDIPVKVHCAALSRYNNSPSVHCRTSSKGVFDLGPDQS